MRIYGFALRSRHSFAMGVTIEPDSHRFMKDRRSAYAVSESIYALRHCS